MIYTATYSPDDNKLRLYSASRLPKDVYERARAAGFIWAPKQGLFVAPMWTPDREDFLLELCGEIGDEDTSLVERAEERADRFEGYSEKRAADADRAHDAVRAIADNIPLGQPILVGHHSERHARRDAERIENGMRKAVKMWETSKYWVSRAAGALRHAKYKELPPVRARRIKKIEADKRRAERSKAEAEKWLALWTKEGLTLKQAQLLAGVCHLRVIRRDDGLWWSAYDVLRPDDERYAACPAMTVEQVQDAARCAYPKSIACSQRWIAHYENRLLYERAMLEEQGASELLERKPRPKQLPLCNYRAAEGLKIENIYHRGEMIHYPQKEMTQAEYAKIWTDYKGTRVVENSHRVRIAYQGLKGGSFCVFLTDAKVHEKPPAKDPPKREPRRVATYTPTPKPEPTPFDAMKEQLRNGGIQVVSAPQLFPTPKHLAERIAERANIRPGDRVLEPSAGTGALLGALGGRMFGHNPESGQVVAVEVNSNLAEHLRLNFPLTDVRCTDFLQCNGDLGKFDAIVMNPPFADGKDVEHVTHALGFLKDGGRLVAIMSAGVTFRQDRKTTAFRALVEERGGMIEELPDDSFKEAGASVRTVMITI